MNAIIYARQSSGKDDYSESVETQLENCRKLAERETLNVIGCYFDLNTSGKTYPVGAESVAGHDTAFQEWFKQQTGTKMYRSGLGEVFKHLKEADFIIVDEMTRLYRPVTRSFLESFVNQKLTEHSVQILQCKGGKLDLKQFDQQLIQMLKNQIQDEAIANQKKKSKEQFRKMRDAGLQCNGAKMFGIRYLGNRQLEVIPECAEVIRFIYNEIAAYRPYSAILRDVNQKFRHCFKRYCYETSFYSIARQPIYCGYQYNSRHELIRNIQMTGKEIISYELWEKVGKILDSKKKNPPVRAKKHWLPVSGMMFCGHCGGKLTCQIDRGKLFYHCNKVNLTRERECSQSRIRFQGSEKSCALYEALYPVLLFGLRQRLEKNLNALQEKDSLREMENKLDIMKNKEQELFELFVNGIITRDQMEDILIKHKSERQILQLKVQHLNGINTGELEHEREVILPDLYARIKLRALENGEYEQLLRETVHSITVYDQHIVLDLIAGELVIPRKKVGNRKSFPDWNIQDDCSKGKSFFHFEEYSSSVRICYRSGREKVLLNDNKIIFTEE